MFGRDIKRGMRTLFLSVVLLVVFIGITHTVNAFGVSTPYLENDTLRVLAGQNYTYSLTLQNGDDADYYVDIIYSSTNNVASLVSGTYFTPAKTYNNTFDFNVNIPPDAKIGDKYVLEYSARPRTMGVQGTVTLGVEIKRSINILVTDKENTNVKPIQVSIERLKNINYDRFFKIILSGAKYALPALVILLIILVIAIIWKVSRRMTSKLGHKRKTDQTISQASSLSDVRDLLQKISDEQFELLEIRNLFKKKLTELTNNEIVDEILRISRQDAITALDHILQ